MAKTPMANPAKSVAEVCQSLQVSRGMLYRSIGKSFVTQELADQLA